MYTRITTLPISITNNDVIVDVETVGDWNHMEVTQVGWVKGSELIQVIRESYEEKFDFQNLMDTEWEDCTLWAWNCSFEAKVTGLKYSELKRSWNKKKPMREIIHIDGTMSKDYYLSKDIPAIWEKFIETNDVKYRDQVLAHNLNCLGKELTAYVYLNISYG